MKRDIGTPIGGERMVNKQGQQTSPLQQMDGMPNGMGEQERDVQEGEVKDCDGEDVTSMFKNMMIMMKSVKAEVSGMRNEVSAATNAANQARLQAGVAMQVAETTAGEVKELSKKIDEVKQSTVSKEGVHSMIEEMIETKLAKIAQKDVLRAEGSSEALFGGSGLQSATRQEAEDWVNRKLQELRAEEPTDIYHKVTRSRAEVDHRLRERAAQTIGKASLVQ